MSRYEKFILLLIILVLLGRFSGFARDIYIARHYGSTIPIDVERYWTQISILFGGFVNVGVAIWLFVEAKAIKVKGWVWALSGLFFGLIGLILFYAIQTFDAHRSNEP